MVARWKGWGVPNRNMSRYPARVVHGAGRQVDGANPVTLTVHAAAAFEEVAYVAKGDYWHFKAHGEWHDAFVACSPQGYSNRLAVLLGLPPEVESAPLFALCGKIVDGNNQTVPGSEFEIGKEAVIEMPATGTLVVFANDVARFPIFRKNNKGSIHLTAVQVAAPPAAGTPEDGVDGARAGKESLLERWFGLVEAVRRTQGMILISALVFITLYVLAGTPQGRDILTTVAEDESSLTKVFLVIGLTYLGIQAWFWPRRIIEANYGYDKEKWGRYRLLFTWWPRLLGVAPHIVAGSVILSDRHASAAAGGGMLLFVMLVVALVFVAYVISRDRLMDLGNKADNNPLKVLLILWPLFGVIFSAAMFFAFTFAPATLGQLVGPAAIVFLAVAGVLPYAAIIIQAAREFRLPVTLLFLLLAILSSNTNYSQHTVGRRSFDASAAYMETDTRPDLETALDQWVAQSPGPVRIKGEDRLPLVIVATEGGASRAGYWTATVLNALEQQSGGMFSRRTFAISSISGGSLGAVGWVATLPPPCGLSSETYENKHRWPVLKSFVGADALSPALASSLFPSAIQRFLPFPILPDGGEGIEEGWERSWRTATAGHPHVSPDTMRQPYLDLWTGAGKLPAAGEVRWIPHLLIGGASEETGERVLTSSVRFRSRWDKGDKLPSDGVGQLPEEKDDKSAPGRKELPQIDARDFFRASQLDIHASTAILNGARFPWISPAGFVPTDSGGFHIVDGGYFDASGIETARELLVWINSRKDDYPAIYPILVIINYREQAFGGMGEQPNTFINDAVGPVIGLYSARDGHQSHMLHPVESVTEPDDSPWEVRYMTLRAEPYATMPMDWVLSSRAKSIAEAKVGTPLRPYDQSAAPDIAELVRLLRYGDGSRGVQDRRGSTAARICRSGEQEPVTVP